MANEPLERVADCQLSLRPPFRFDLALAYLGRSPLEALDVALDGAYRRALRINGRPRLLEVRAGGTIECESCHHSVAAPDAPVLELRRLEGASDPDDMLAVVAVECPNCGLRGSLVLNYGPTATVEDSAVLVGLGDAPR